MIAYMYTFFSNLGLKYVKLSNSGYNYAKKLDFHKNVRYNLFAPRSRNIVTKTKVKYMDASWISARHLTVYRGKKLFQKLLNYGITGKVFDTICHLYDGDKTFIKISDKISQGIEVGKGV